MRRLALTLVCTLALILSFGSAQAEVKEELPKIIQEEALTLTELIDLAKANQAAYRRTVDGERIIAALNRSAIGQFLPSVSFGGSWSDYSGETVVEGVAVSSNDYASSSLRLNVNEALFEGGSRYFGYKNARLQIFNTKLATERSEDLLIAQVKTAFFNLLASQDYLKVQEEVLQHRLEAERLARARFATGDVIELDVMQSEIDVGTQRNAILQAQQGVENAREALNLTVGLHLDSRYPIEGNFDPQLPQHNATDLVRTALTSRPDLIQQQNAVQYYHNQVRIQQTGYLPSFGLFYSWGRSESAGPGSFVISPDQSRSTSVGISMNWTLFDRFNREYNIQNAKISKRQAQWDEIQARQQVDSEVRTGWRSLEVLYAQIQVSEKNRELARRQLVLEQERYRIGASDQLNLRSAQVTFITAEQDYLTRVLNFYTTLATLERDLGTTLDAATR